MGARRRRACKTYCLENIPKVRKVSLTVSFFLLLILLRKLNEEKVSTNFTHFNDINPLVMPDKSELETESGELRERADTLSGELEKVTFLMITKMTMLISGES